MIVEENGKLYNIDEKTGLVTEATAAEAENAEVANFSDDLRIGDRVEVEGELGEIVSITASVYGGAFGVRFDDGAVDEYLEGQLKRSTVEKPDYDSPIAEVLGRFEHYSNLPHFTNVELDRKEIEARWLNLRAKSLVTDSKLALSDQNELGRIVLITGTDLLDIKEARHTSEDSQRYVSSFNRYRISNEVQGGGAIMGLKGDASWLDDAMADLEVVETVDADLAARAVEVAAQFSRPQLEDDSFIATAASYQHDYLQLDDGQREKFNAYLAGARAERLKDIPKTKVAKADENLDDFDASAIFL